MVESALAPQFCAAVVAWDCPAEDKSRSKSGGIGPFSAFDGELGSTEGGREVFCVHTLNRDADY